MNMDTAVFINFGVFTMKNCKKMPINFTMSVSLVCSLISLPSAITMIKSRWMRWAGHVARMEEKRNANRLLVGKPEGKRPLRRPRCRWVDNIRMNLGEVGWGDLGWISLVQDRNR
jgi:hypothetical protein